LDLGAPREVSLSAFHVFGNVLCFFGRRCLPIQFFRNQSRGKNQARETRAKHAVKQERIVVMVIFELVVIATPCISQRSQPPYKKHQVA
jgi:hypothetical protein